MGDEQTVSYSLPDVLRRIEEKVDKIDRNLDGKADRSELAALQAAHAEMGKEISALKTAEQNRDKGGESRRANVALAVSTVAALATAGELAAMLLTSGH